MKIEAKQLGGDVEAGLAMIETCFVIPVFLLVFLIFLEVAVKLVDFGSVNMKVTLLSTSAMEEYNDGFSETLPYSASSYFINLPAEEQEYVTAELVENGIVPVGTTPDAYYSRSILNGVGGVAQQSQGSVMAGCPQEIGIHKCLMPSYTASPSNPSVKRVAVASHKTTFLGNLLMSFATVRDPLVIVKNGRVDESGAVKTVEPLE